MMRIIFTLVLLIASIFYLVGKAHADNKQTIREIELTPPPINFDDINRIWTWLKKEVGAPEDLPPPLLVLDWEVPIRAKMGFQYPTKEYPENRLQISVAPRTIDMLSWYMVLFGIGHELTHYIILLRENDYDVGKKTYDDTLLHHCNPEFLQVTRNIAEEIWNIYHSDHDRARMYNEVIKACSRFPGQ